MTAALLVIAGVSGLLSFAAWPHGPAAAPAAATTTAPVAADTAASFVLRARAVYPATAEQPGPLSPGIVIVRDGKIAAVGSDLPLPPDLPVLELRDEVVCPGFVSAGSGLAGQHAGPETASGLYRAIDAFNAHGAFAPELARGTTTVHLDPGEHRLISGVGAVVKLAGAPEARILRSAADVTITLGVFDPPPLVDPPFYASSDVAIEPARPQRPDSRLGMYAELAAQFAAAQRVGTASDAGAAPFDLHALALAEALRGELPLRVNVRRAADIAGAIEFLAQLGDRARGAYLVGLTEAGRLPAAAGAADLPVVVRVEERYRDPGGNLGPDPDALAPCLATAAALHAAGCQRLALAGGTGDLREDLRMTAILAHRAGLPAAAALAGITRHPAELLGVADRVGSLAPGRDADLLVLSGEPLDINAHVLRVYVDGTVVLDAPPAAPGVPATQPADPPRPTVVRAGTLWLGNGTILRDGALLIENGKIAAVGQRVPTPPRARIIDAGADAVVVPGFIDAYGHLGLAGDTTVATPDTAVQRTVAHAGSEFQRVARAGVTTVVQAPYRGTNKGMRLAAIKTWGRDRTELVARELTGLRFSLRGQDPVGGLEPLRQALQAGRKYDEDWKKYAAELEKWKQGGGAATTRPAEAETVATGRPDPITGTWDYTVRGGPLPEPMNGTIAVRLTGNSIEGRLSDPLSGEEANVTGTLDGTDVKLEIDVDTPMGRPTIRATLDREDHMAGQVSVGEVTLDFSATRTSKAAVEFKIQVRTRRAKDGRPAPPKRDENLEPYRDLLAGRIPAVVEVENAAQVGAALKFFVDEQKLGLVLLAGPDAADAAELLLARREQCGVVVPREMFVTRARQPYCPAVDLSRRGVRLALQSDSEDAARNLPLMALYAVQQGLGGDAALAALTVDAARMYKLDDRLGALEPGKDADVLIFRGHPFDAGSRLERVLVGGREVPDVE